MERVVNAFTVDLEDWYQGLEIFKVDSWDRFESRIEVSCRKILDVLKRHDTRATFFVLGRLAETNPDLIRTIHDGGHEIASHGYSHTQIFHLTPEQLRSELVRTNEAIHRITGERPVGFRAPIFSITGKTFWALDVLLENGFMYDSSIFPTINYRYGMLRANRFRHELPTSSGKKITEIPVTTSKFLGINLPVGGGAYFRIWPYLITRWGFRQVNRAKKPCVFYIHPWELDPDHSVVELPKRISMTHYHRIAATEKKLEKLFRDFTFSRITDVFDINGHYGKDRFRTGCGTKE